MKSIIHIVEDAVLNWPMIDRTIDMFNERKKCDFVYEIAQSSRVPLREDVTRLEARKLELARLNQTAPVILICDINLTELPLISKEVIRGMGILPQCFGEEANGLVLLYSATRSSNWNGLVVVASMLVAPMGFESITQAFDPSKRLHWFHAKGGLSSPKDCGKMLATILEHFEEIYSDASIRCYPKSSEAWFT